MDDGSKAAVLVAGLGAVVSVGYLVVRRVFGAPPPPNGNTDNLETDDPVDSSNHGGGPSDGGTGSHHS